MPMIYFAEPKFFIAKEFYTSFLDFESRSRHD